ncbi:MAG: hypothetical protein ACLFRA_03960 [Alphaproteobacteria bacterium]
MKKLFLTATVAVVAFGFTQTAQADSSVQLTIDGDMPKICDVDQYGDFRLQDLDLTSTAQTDAASITISCNYQGTANVEFSSANAGALVSTSDPEHTIPYTASLSGGLLSDVSLATPQTANNFPTVVGDQTRGFSVKLAPPAVVPAGFYEDVVTATVATN